MKQYQSGKQLVRLSLIIVLSIVYQTLSYAKECKIKGYAPEYKQVTLDFIIKDDIITQQEVVLASTAVNDTGYFELEVDIEETTQIFCYLGIYKGNFFAEPGSEYDLVLPPRRDIGLAQELNPYFIPTSIKIGIKNSDENELNYLISDFDYEYSAFITENFYWIYITADLPLVDSITKVFNEKYLSHDNSFLQNYIEYKIAGLRHLAYERDMLYATKKYLLNKPFLYNNEAYSVFFNEMFDSYFTVSYADGLVKQLHEAVIYYKSPYRLKQILETKISFRNDTLKELIILKGLYDAYSKPDIYPRNTVDQTLDSLLLLTNNDYVKKAGRNIFKRVDKVFVGDPIPNIKGVTPEGDSLGLHEFNGKYIYLQFCRSENYACQKDYRLIKDLHNELPAEELEIVTLGYEQSFSDFKSYINRNSEYTWEFIYCKDEGLLKLFNVKAMPTYVLIDPDGNIALNPAPSPHENFGKYFAMIIRWRDAAKRMKEEYTIPQE